MSNELPSLDGRRFAVVGDARRADVGTDTVFRYHEVGEVVWADFDGGRVRMGTLVGTRSGNMLSFHYTQLNAGGATATGRCRTQISRLPDGRLRLDEAWRWSSGDGSGASVLEELPAPAPARVTVDAALAALAAQTDERFVSMLTERGVEVELYEPVGHDPQAPHDRDELYVVISGTGTFERAGDQVPFGPHDVLYVPAGVEHRFAVFDDDFAVWVIFVGPTRLG